MTKISVQLKTTSDEAVSGIILTDGSVQQFRVYVDGDTTETLVNACRADFWETARTAEERADQLAVGQEILEEGMIEGSVDGITYQDISGFANALDLGAVLSGGYADLYLRLTVPIDSETGATVGFGLAFRVR